MPFEFVDYTEMKLLNVSFRIEKHGDNDVLGASFKLQLTGPNTMLDKPFPGLRKAIYTAVEGQEVLPGMEESTPKLRSKLVSLYTLNQKYEGWTVSIDYGIDSDDPIVMSEVKLDNFTILAMEGGTIQLTMRAGTNDIDPEESGQLLSKMKQNILVKIKAPEKPVAAIDGTVGHPGLAKQAEQAGQLALADLDDGNDPETATGAFVAAAQADGDAVAPGAADGNDAGEGGGSGSGDGAGPESAGQTEANPPATDAAATAPAAKVTRGRRKTAAQFIDAHTSIE